MPPIASATEAKPARGAYGPGLAVAGDARDDEPGFASHSRSGPRFHRSSVPGRKFSTSDVALLDELEQQLLAPLLRAGSSVTHFLFRDCTGHQSERPS